MKQDWRYELKTLGASHLLSEARTWIRLHPAGFIAPYPSRWVNSLYLDTSGLACLNANLGGHSQRTKVRLRWYGQLGTRAQRPLLELKHKRNMLGYKERMTLSSDVRLTQTWDTLLAQIRAWLPVNGRIWLQETVQPTLINHYRREYYATYDGQIRVTLDYNQNAYDQRHTTSPNLEHPLTSEDRFVVEIKAPMDQWQRLEDVMRYFPLRRGRNSKYVNGMIKTL
jgi:SPX domain protein involved in polyphosphate accumulation